MDFNLLLRLIFAHFVSDFLLQNKKLVAMKTNECILLRHEGLAIHSFIHAFVSYLFVAQWGSIFIPIILFFTHYILDLIKGNRKGARAFVIDQCAHLLVLAGIWMFCTGVDMTAIGDTIHRMAQNDKLWVVLIAYVLMTKPSSILLAQLVDRWKNDVTTNEGLNNAGAWIGYIERLLILTFILTGYYTGIGWVLAAKSIFRFGDLNRAKNIKMTEYVLIGTFVSFFIAIGVGAMVNFVR